MRVVLTAALLAGLSLILVFTRAGARQDLEATCPGVAETLPFSMYSVIAQVAPQRRGGTLRYTARYPRERYSDVFLVPMRPRTSQPDPTWLSLGMIGCRRPADQAGPAGTVDKRDFVFVAPIREVSVCRGSSGVALLDPTSIRRLPATAMTCTTPPNPEGQVIQGSFYENCRYTGSPARWVCRITPVYLHSTGKKQCFRYGVEDVHEYQAYMTVGRDAGGRRVPVDMLNLQFQIGPDRGTQSCASASSCAKTIKEYNLGCRRPCVSATATHRGSRWATNQVCW